MKNWKLFFAVGCGLIVAACGEESAAQKAVRASLNDPDSAKFGKSTFVQGAKGESYACLTINAKNSIGGYTGDQQAALMKAESEWQVITINKLDHASCIKVISGQ